MTTKILQIQIVKPLDTDWNTLGQGLRDVQYQTWKVANKTIQMLWDYSNFNYAYKERFGEYIDLKKDKLLPRPNDNGFYNNVISDIRNELMSEADKMNSIGYTATLKMVEDKWKNDYIDVINGRKSIANFKRDLPIEVNTPQMKNKQKELYLEKDNKGNYSIEIKLISQKYAIELGRKGTETGFKLALAVKDNYQKAIVDRVISGEYKLSMSKLINRKKKWFLNLAYTFTPEKKVLDENKVLGIDLGVKIPAMLAVSDNKFFRESVGSSEEITNFQKQVESRKRSLQRQRKWCGEGSIGHGTKTRIKPLEKLSGKIKRFKDTKNHNWSRYIVDRAIKNKCGTIQMEDLSGIAEENTFLKTWTYYDLQQKIKYKAEEKGIKIVMINPYKTSQRCSKCGHIHKDNRETQEKFKCVECGFEANADWNAAKNIATPNIEKIIEEQVKKQEKELKHNMKYAI
jgi:putative transposase